MEVTDWDQKRFEAALNKLIVRHEMLRSIVLPEGRQQILQSVPAYRVEATDLRAKDSATVARQLEAVRQQMSHQLRPSDRWPLFEFRVSHLDAHRSLLHVCIDLLISDNRSFQIFFGELAQLYLHPDTILPPLELSFRDYLAAAGAFEEMEPGRRSREYWLQRVPTMPPSPELPLAKNPTAIAQPEFVRRHARLDAATWKSLKEKSARIRVTPDGVLLAAYAEVLGIWSKSPRMTINLTLFNRLPIHKQVNDIVGDFTSVTLLEVDNSKPQTFEARTRKIQEQLWQDVDHRHFSGLRVMREITRLQGVGPKAIMPVVFTSLLNIGEESGVTNWASKLGKTVYALSQTPQVYLDFIVQEENDELVINWDAVDELFPAGLLDHLFQAYQFCLRQLASDDASWQRTLAENTERFLPAAQRQIRQAANDTQASLSDELLHTLFLKQVEQRPNQIAVRTPTHELTYRELFQSACRIEEELLRRGVEPNQLVGVLMEKGWEQVAAVLGIHFAGGAYLPIDPELPPKRQRHLIEHGQVRIVLTQSALEPFVRLPKGVEVLAVDDLQPAAATAPVERRRQKPEDLAYVIYTSGSTGLPKGVMIDHRGAVNTVLDINQRFGVGPGDRVLAVSRLNFDLSVYDIFGLLAAGGTIVMPAADRALDATHWAELVAAEKITLWNTVPTLMQLLVEQEDPSRSIGQSLRLILMSGDWIPIHLPALIRQVLPKAKIVSLGGATEASIWSILYPIEHVISNWKSIPYGKPMVNQTFHVLNPVLAACPGWVPGQLYIGGVGLAKGYWRDEQKTKDSFFEHPVTGERLYRTGDLGRYLPDGNIEFLGREDFQVKVNGYRIELGEIEVRLQEHMGVENCVVTVREDTPGQRRLVAYVVLKPGVQLEAADLRESLQVKLPDYMVPSAFVFLERFPLSPNGKVDRKALPAPARAGVEADPELAAPRDALELQLIELWEKVLGVHAVGRQDNFFDLGGSSMMAVRLFAQIEKSFGRKIPLAALFKTPTIAQLADILRGDKQAAPWSCLVPFRTAGTHPPLFCIHGHTGEVLFYRHFANRLGAEQPFYALQARGIIGGEAHSTIEEMAGYYIRDIRSVQAHGPYFVAGYCFGGRVAFEIAQQLRDLGEEVALVAVFDTYFPSYSTTNSLRRLHRQLNARAVIGATLAERIRIHTDKLKSLDTKGKLAHISHLGSRTLASAGVWMKQRMWQAAYNYYTWRGRSVPGRLQNVPDLNLQAAVRHDPKAYPDRITLLVSGPLPEGYYPDPKWGWRGLRASEFDIRVVPGEEDGMFREPFVVGVAEVLASCVREACARVEGSGMDAIPQGSPLAHSGEAVDPESGRLQDGVPIVS